MKPEGLDGAFEAIQSPASSEPWAGRLHPSAASRETSHQGNSSPGTGQRLTESPPPHQPTRTRPDTAFTTLPPEELGVVARSNDVINDSLAFPPPWLLSPSIWLKSRPKTKRWRLGRALKLCSGLLKSRPRPEQLVTREQREPRTAL